MGLCQLESMTKKGKLFPPLLCQDWIVMKKKSSAAAVILSPCQIMGIWSAREGILAGGQEDESTPCAAISQPPSSSAAAAANRALQSCKPRKGRDTSTHRAHLASEDFAPKREYWNTSISPESRWSWDTLHDPSSSPLTSTTNGTYLKFRPKTKYHINNLFACMKGMD